MNNGSSSMSVLTEIVQSEKISRVEVSIEMPENMLGIYRIESSIVYFNNDHSSYNDQKIVDNTEYYSEKEIVEALAKRYNVSTDIIEVV